MADTGNGATLTLSSTGSVGDIRQMTLPEFVLEKIEDSHLGTTNFKTYIPSDLEDPGEFTAEIIFDSGSAVPARGTVETATVTFPIANTSNTNAATLAGTGFLTTYKIPDLANGELQVASLTFAFDGQTEPAFTAES